MLMFRNLLMRAHYPRTMTARRDRTNNSRLTGESNVPPLPSFSRSLGNTPGAWHSVRDKEHGKLAVEVYRVGFVLFSLCRDDKHDGFPARKSDALSNPSALKTANTCSQTYPIVFNFTHMPTLRRERRARTAWRMTTTRYEGV